MSTFLREHFGTKDFIQVTPAVVAATVVVKTNSREVAAVVAAGKSD